MRTPAQILLRAEHIRGLLNDMLEHGADEEALVWEYAPRLRAFFHEHAFGERFVISFDENLRLWASLRDHIESQIYFHGMQEGDRGLVRLIKRMVQPGWTVVDAGANVGVYSLMMAKRIAPHGRVHAFEPVPALNRLLKRNLMLNPELAITTQGSALSGGEGEVTIYVPSHNNKGMSSLHPDGGSHTCYSVPKTSLDRYVQHCGIDRLDFVKIDVEGHELSVLRGAAQTLARLRPRIACELSRAHLGRAGSSPEAVADYMGKRGYRRYGIAPDGSLVEGSLLTDHENAFFVPRDAEHPHT